MGRYNLMKSKRILIIVIILIFTLLFFVFSFYFFPRVFGNEEIKTMYNIKDILNSYINFKSDNLVDLIDHVFYAGSYKYENDRLQLSLGVKTDKEIIDVVFKADSLCGEIKSYIDNKSNFNSEKIDISIRIENWSNGAVILEPTANRIVIGVDGQTSITDILSHCKDFEVVEIGGYWGYDISIPDDIEEDFFADFNALKTLKISDIRTSEMKSHFDEIVSNLCEKGVKVITEVQQSYQLEKNSMKQAEIDYNSTSIL